MKETRYLVVGGGMAGEAACVGIRETDANGEIVVLGAEPDPPYARPPLSKGLWKGDDESSVWYAIDDLGVQLALGRQAVALDLGERIVEDDQGERYRYERLLLATGGRPRRLPFGGDDVLYFRTLADYRRLRQLADRGGRFVVLGGGFIGSELAAALAMNELEVTMVFPEEGIGARVFPGALSLGLVEYYRERGVEVLAGASVTGIERAGATTRVTLDDGRVLEADSVVAGLGIEPSVELAAAAGLEVSDGVRVDALRRAGGREDVFAAGDVARFPVAALATETRVEHEDHARTHGRRVGANMAGAAQPYDHLPFFYSDLFDVGYEAVGELDPHLDTLVELEDVRGQGFVYYLGRDGRARGVLLWNTFGRVDDARELIRSREAIAPGVLGRAG